MHHLVLHATNTTIATDTNRYETNTTDTVFRLITAIGVLLLLSVASCITSLTKEPEIPALGT